MPGPAAPVAPHERQPLIDALRGLALAGVLLANLGYLSLYDFTTEASRASLPTAAFDHFALTAMEWLVNSKAITVFSLLFGLGFAIQLERAQARGSGGLRHYLQRLGWLLVIGLAHSYFIWWGDILTIYAVIGLLLVLFRRAPDGVLLWGGMFIAVLLPALISPWLNSVLDGESQRSSIYASSLLAFSADSWRDTFAANTALVHWTRLMNWSLVCFVLGRFLLGYWAGRRQLLQRATEHLPLLRRILVGALIVAVLAGAVLWLFNANPGWREQTAGRLLRGSVLRLAPLALAIAYAAAFALLFQHTRWRRVLGILAPLGQMALTNYLLQSVLGIFLFYGIGLGIGPNTGLSGWLLAWLGILLAQILFSHFWLARFRYGPCEWAWRSLTYGKWQPIRLPRVALAS